MTSYPSKDIERDADADVHPAAHDTVEAAPTNAAPSSGDDRRPRDGDAPKALISAVSPGSPAYDAGFEPGCSITSVDGRLLRDIIDWRWFSGDESITLGYIDLDGDEGEVELWREPGEDWGFEFEGLLFDQVKQCRNACTFCFMRQLPRGMRKSLYLRDDDFRLSFLVGTFVTLTNMTDDDAQRICEQRISPLRVSLQAVSADVRSRLIGKHAAHGLAMLDRLLDAGITFHAQIVLVPGENDGEELMRTLDWAYARPGIEGVGIVPLGYTRFQTMFDRSFDTKEASENVLRAIEPYQQRALEQRGTPWVYAADEFYRNALGMQLVDELPDASFYGDYAMFEDGIGIVRSVLDGWSQAEEQGLASTCADTLQQYGLTCRLVIGLAQREFLDVLLERSELNGCIEPLYVRNDFFGGNVDVTGLLVGEDIVNAIARAEREHAGRAHVYCVMRVVFNDDGVTLDGMSLEDMEKAAGHRLHMVSCSPEEYLSQIAEIARGLG